MPRINRCSVIVFLAFPLSACATVKPCVVPAIHLWTLDDPAPATFAERVARAEHDPALNPIRCSVGRP